MRALKFIESRHVILLLALISCTSPMMHASPTDEPEEPAEDHCNVSGMLAGDSVHVEVEFFCARPGLYRSWIRGWFVFLAEDDLHYDEPFADVATYRRCGEQVAIDLRLPPSPDNGIVFDAAIEPGEGEVPNPYAVRCESDPIRLR
jgi:hypothetical protein